MSLVKLVFWFKCRKYAEEASPKFLVSLAKLLTKKLLIKRGMRSYKGEWDPDVAKKTLIIVSHEASRTGAPILALNICKELIEFKNIVVISLKDGELIEDLATQH